MKIAVPMTKGRVSPHFGAFGAVLVLELEGPLVKRQRVLETARKGPMEVARTLVAEGITKLYCGGIQSSCREWLEAKGVQVVADQRGNISDLLQAATKTGATDLDGLPPGREAERTWETT